MWSWGVFEECDRKKNAFMDTASACSAANFHFSPILCGAQGEWSTLARHIQSIGSRGKWLPSMPRTRMPCCSI